MQLGSLEKNLISSPAFQRYFESIVRLKVSYKTIHICVPKQSFYFDNTSFDNTSFLGTHFKNPGLDYVRENCKAFQQFFPLPDLITS